ncbi:MAG: hypothetical protein K2J01_00880 [Clostridiales bacterium]|nr:hypothetical protein [Clostridiales bacterium]
MEHITVKKNRLMTMLLTILFSAVIFCCALFAGFGFGATAETAGTYAAGKYDLTTVTVSLNDGWIFTSDTPDSELYRMVTVSVTYTNESDSADTVTRDLVLSDTAAATGETVTFSRNTTAKTITATVAMPASAEYNAATMTSAAVTYTLSTATPVVNGIVAYYDATSGGEVNTRTDANASVVRNHVTAYQAYNDGTHNNQKISSFNLEGDFFPSKWVEGMTNGSTYAKEITVNADGYSTTVLATGVVFVEPDRIDDMEGSFLTQTARSRRLNIKDLKIKVQYDQKGAQQRVRIDVPAAVFPDDCYISTYYDAEDKEVVDATGRRLLNRTVKTVVLTFKYPGWDEDKAFSKYFLDVTVDPISIHTPTFPGGINSTKTTLSWGEDGASIDISDWNFDTLHTDTGAPPAPVIKIDKFNVGSGSYEALSDSDTAAAVGAVSGEKVTVSFSTAGTKYRVKVILPDDGDFWWDSPYNGTKSDDNMTMTFEVQVDKGKPVATLADIADTIYGTPNGSGKLSAEIKAEDGSLVPMGNDWYEVPSTTADNTYENDDDEWHYRLAYYTSYTSVTVNTPVPASNLSGGRPKRAGTYYAVATTYENSGYESVTSNAVSFTVEKYTIDTAVADKTFARTDWTVNDFILPNDVTKGFPYGDTALGILNVKDSANNVVDANTKFRHADNYSVNVEIKNDAAAKYRDNYELTGKKTTDTVTFTIKTNEDSDFGFDATGWTYGASGANPNINITSKSATYYPSNTGVVATDYTVKYYKYDAAATDNKGDEVTVTAAGDLEKFEVGRYVIELIANQNTADGDGNETAALVAGTQVDYTLPSASKDFLVVASPIVAPYLDMTATDWTTPDQTAKLLYTYDDTKTGKDYEFESWIGDGTANTAADGSAIITVVITYTTYKTASTETVTGFAGGKFKVNYAGDYTVTVTLNSNYSWKTQDASGNPIFYPTDGSGNAVYTYSYQGYVAKQQLTVLTNGNITGATDTYDSTSQNKTITSWNENALTITSVTVGGLETGHTPVSGGITVPDNTTPTNERNIFGVTNAGKYTVKVDIADQDNYEWLGATSDTDGLRTLSLEYVLNRAPMLVTWSDETRTDFGGTFNKTPDTEYPCFVFNSTKPAQATPEANANVFPADNVNIDIVGYTLYKDNNGAFGSTLTKVENAGYYRIVVSEIGGTAAPNYYLPANDDTTYITNIATLFKISAKTFDRPELVVCPEVSGTAIVVVYNGTGYRLSDYIQYFNDNYYSKDDKLNDVLCLDIKCGEDGTNNPLLKDVLWNSDKTQIIAYEINVKPADNYAWSSGDPNETLTYTIKITQKVAAISWGTTKFETTYGEVTQPNPTVGNAETGDTVNITLGYKQGDTAVADITKAAAGEYTVYASALDNLNYIIDDQKVDYSIGFTIKKKALVKPVFAGLSGAEFDGSATTTSDLYSNTAAEKTAWKNGTLFTAAVTAKLDSAWFTEAVADNDEALTIDTTDNTKYAFDTATGKLTYYAAGVYTVTFTLTDSANYCWAGDGKESEFDDTEDYTCTWGNNKELIVNRMVIDAPALGNQRAMERDNPAENKQLNTIFTGTLGNADNGIEYTVQYGARDGDGFGAPQAEQPANVIGQYYVLLSTTDKYNYTWAVNPDGENNTFAKSSYITPIDGRVYKTEYTIDGGARVYLLYAITATQLNVVVVVTDYTYGDNGYDASDKVVLDYRVEGDKKVFDYQNHDNLVAQGATHGPAAYTFFKLDADGNRVKQLTDADLVNYLPWEAGNYEADIVINFDDSNSYQPWTDTRSFKVEKRTLTLEWTFGGDTKQDGGKFTTTYNGEEQKPTYTITNLPKKTAGDNPTEPQLTFAAQAIPNKTAFTDAAEYTIDTVSFADSAAVNDNYKFGEYTLYFEITPKQVTLTATAQNHTYGDELIFAASDCLDDDTKAQFYTRDGLAFILMQVKDGATVLTDTLGVVYGGTYTLVPVFDADNNSSENYTVTATTAAALNVLKRAITVTVTNNPTSVYSEDIADITYTVSLTSGGEGTAVVDTESDVFTIAARKDGNVITNKTDVGDYYIVLIINNTRSGNYDFTLGTTAAADGATTVTHEAYKYSITAKQIAEKKDSEGNDTIVANTLTYNGAAQKFLADGFDVVIGNPEIADNAPVWSYSEDGTTWTTFTQSPTVKEAGTYNFVIKATAKNHTAFTKNITVTVGKAELTVKFDLTIMFGEDDPASVSYLFGLDNLRTENKGWTVEGFESDADRTLFYTDGASFYNLAGEAKYSVDGYNKAATTTSTHTINFIATADGNPTLTCDNYTFVGAVGTLTVKKVELTVHIKDNSVTYNEPGEYNIPNVNVQGEGYTVDLPKSTYSDSANYVMSEGSLSEIFTISTTAHDQKVGTSTTGKAGSYAVNGTAILTDKYDVTFVGGWNVSGDSFIADANGTCGKYTINPAALDVKTTITNYSGVYDEKWHGIIVDGTNTVQLNGDPTDGVVFATANDGTAVTIKYGYNSTPKKLSKTEFDKLATLSNDPLAFRGVGTYYVHYCLTNPNYTTVLDYRSVDITRANNGLAVAFDFQNKSVSEGTTAWTYGYKVEGGFDPDGANEVIEPEAMFKYASGSTLGTITFQLFYADDEDSLWEKEVDADAADTVANMFAELFAGDGLNAGSYRLNVSMGTTTNYAGFSVDYVFTVAKRALTVKAEVPTQIQYGSVVPTFTDNSQGLVVNSSKAGATADNIVDALGTAPVYATVYTQGYTVGDYRVYANGKADDATDSTSFTNYTVTYKDVLLTVVSREITVNIADKENTYNLRGTDNTTEEIRTLTFTVTDGSIYTAELVGGNAPADGVYDNANQTVLTLYTAAIVGEGDNRNTNNVKFDADGKVTGYTIYAVFRAGVAETNYNVSFAGCSNKEQTEATAIGKDGSANNAGSYVINKAVFKLLQDGVYHKVGDTPVKGTVYSGAVNYYVATLDDTARTPLEFTYTKKDASGNYVAINANQVIGVGEYEATGSSTNPNYTAAELAIKFEITKATLTLTADSGKRVQYGTTLSGSVATDTAKGGAEATGRFDGFTYTAASPTLLASTKSAYLTANTVGYQTAGYSPSANVGAACTITPTCASDANVNVLVVGANLTIVKRSVTVTVVGWDETDTTDASKHNPNAWTYYLGTHGATLTALENSFAANMSSYIYFEDRKEVFGDSGDGYDKLGITVSLPDGVDVGEHAFAYTAANNTNYAVTFANTVAPKFAVKKAKLTIYAHPMQGEYSYTYGETIETLVDRNAYNVGALTYYVDVMQGNDKFVDLLDNRNIVFTIVDKNGKAYAAWESNVGKYTVSLMVKEGENMYAPTAATFQNYEIVEIVNASLNLKQRKISATTQDQTFGFDGTTYNGGLFGKSHNAVITFVDVFGNSANVDAQAYRPSFTLSYNTVKTGTYQTAGAAPTFVGNYKVTVKLGTGSNYVFGDGTDSRTLDFAVNKLVLKEANLGWDTVSYSLDDDLTTEKFTNFIERYVDDYFRVVRFVYTSATGDGTQITAGDKNTLGTYYVENQKMFVTFGRDIGTYTISFVLKDSATGNLALESAIANEINVTFAVSQNKVTMTVQMADFTYGNQPSKVTVMINGGEATTGLTLTYAPVTSANAAEFAQNSKDGNGLENVTGLTYGDLSNATNFNAGYYVLSAEYRLDEIITRRFYVFNVAKRIITAPQSSIAAVTFNGSAQNVVIDYETSYMRPELTTAGGSMTAANGKATFTATAVGTYNVRFILIDPANNVWDTDSADGTFTDAGALTLTWNINKDETANGTEDGAIVELPAVVDDIAYGGAFNPNSVTVKNGYNGTVTLYRMPKTDDNMPAASAEGWTVYNTAARGLDAGEYWLKVVVTDLTGRNFAPKTTVGSFRIVPKTITATISGSMIYGTKLSDTHFDNVAITGLLYGYQPTIGAYSYDFAEAYANFNAGGAYEIILNTDENDEVIGIDAGSNYIVKAARGTLTINKRAVTVTIDSKSSDYSVTPVLTDVNYTAVGLADGEDKSVLGIVFETDATSKSVAGGTYWITIKSYDGTNYEVTQHRALYVINPLEIEVELVRQENITYGDTNIKGATAGEIKIANADADEAFVKSDLQLVIRFTNNNGYDSYYVPTDAGAYTATLVGANSNYKLIGTPSVGFVIDKKTVDVTAFFIGSAVYTGDEIAPRVDVRQQGSKPMYAPSVYVAEQCTFVDAGRHNVTVSLADPANYVWSSTSDVSITLTFIINKAADKQTSNLVIAGWQYGCYDEAVNSPSATVQSGESIIYQYSADGKTFTNVVPENGNAGKYYVRATVAESQNYLAFVGEPVSFDIAKFVVTSPSLTVVTDGKDKNDVYTGDNLASGIVGFNPQLMQIAYDGNIQSLGNSVTVFARDAGTYTVSVSLFNAHNYCWSAGDNDNDGTLQLTWTVARKKIAKPTHDDSTKIVNGSTITYIPVGFDSSIMTIENNAYSYGGTFYAKIALKDTKNYEWATDDDMPFTIKWSIVGSDTVFIVIITILSVLTVATAALIAVQFLLNKRRKRLTADTMQAIEDGANRPAAEQAATEPAAEQAEAEQPAPEAEAEKPEAEQAQTEQPEAEKPEAEQPAAEQAATEDKAEQPETEQAAKKPAAKKSTAKKPAGTKSATTKSASTKSATKSSSTAKSTGKTSTAKQVSKTKKPAQGNKGGAE